MDASLHDSRYSWFRLAISLAIATMGNVGMWIVVVVMPAVETEFGLDRADAAMPYTATMLGFALGNYLIGRAFDRLGIVRVLIGAALLSATGYALAALVHSVTLLSLIHFAIGFGTAAAFGPLIADASQWFVRRRGIAVAIVACGNYLAGAIWPTVLAGTLAAHGWRTVYLVLAGLTLAIMVPLTFILLRQLPAADHARASAAAAANRRQTRLSSNGLILILGLAGIACCVAMAMPQVHIVSLCADLGYGTERGAQMLSVMLACGVVSRLVFGVLSDRLGGVVTLLISSTGQGLALFLFLFFDGPVSLFVVSAVFGLAQGGLVPSYAVIVREFLPPAEAGQRVGFVIMATIVGMALGGWVSGWIYDHTLSYQLAFINGIVWNAANIAIMLFVLSRAAGPKPGTGAAVAV